MKSALDLAMSMANNHNGQQDAATKKKKGQFFTSAPISKYMAELVEINKNQLNIADPGSGTGILIAALVDRIVEEGLQVSLSIDLFETDESIIPGLQDVMEFCQKKMKKCGNDFIFHIIKEDFIFYFSNIFQSNLFTEEKNHSLYDCVISNPPYFKLPITHPYCDILKDYIHGQPNIYFMFMAVAGKILVPKGQMVFIVPRSFTSGAYFEKFRRKFLENVSINHIHLFNSRKDNFHSEKVLQENLVLSGINTVMDKEIVKVSSSSNGNVELDYEVIEIPYSDLISPNSEEKTIRIPTTIQQYEVLKNFDKWTNNIIKMGLKISTGKVVAFRNKENIIPYDRENTFPLLYMKNLKIPFALFPIDDTDKGIKKNCKSSLLIPSKNYLLLKRFTSKEQKKRIECSIYDATQYPEVSYLGLENHVNYIYRVDDKITEEELYGLAMILNSNHVDMYFRIVNGNTQVNASDIKPLPLPSIEKIKDIGKRVLSKEINLENIDKYLKEYIIGSY